MAIIISKNGKNAKKIDKSSFDKEDYLQKYIYDNPDAIPLYDIKEDIRLLILAREFPTNSGPIDALGIDKEGQIYIIETKLYKNPDKRTVIAQALDYGSALWRHTNDFNEFIDEINRHVLKIFDISINQKIEEFFDINKEDVDKVLDAIKSNLEEGSFHFVVLIDKLDDRLKDLIVFVNQNSQFDIFAVELEYYKHDDYEIIIPRLYGAEVKKDIEVSSSARKEWNKERFFQAIIQQLERPQADSMKKIYEGFENMADEIRWGTGSLVGSYAPILNKIAANKSLLSIYSNGKLNIKFSWFSNNETEKAARDKLKNSINKYSKGLNIPENFRDIELRFDPGEWLPHAEGIIKSFGELKE
ncbi:MAG: hypothetical protein NTZ84_02940 [Candidatus Nealsonbacteria bacterium]|nr:hypothetical protein [Candidatus Nealsonbacteria bacterium]